MARLVGIAGKAARLGWKHRKLISFAAAISIVVAILTLTGTTINLSRKKALAMQQASAFFSAMREGDSEELGLLMTHSAKSTAWGRQYLV